MKKTKKNKNQDAQKKWSSRKVCEVSPEARELAFSNLSPNPIILVFINFALFTLTSIAQ